MSFAQISFIFDNEENGHIININIPNKLGFYKLKLLLWWITLFAKWVCKAFFRIGHRNWLKSASDTKIEKFSSTQIRCAAFEKGRGRRVRSKNKAGETTAASKVHAIETFSVKSENWPLVLWVRVFFVLSLRSPTANLDCSKDWLLNWQREREDGREVLIRCPLHSVHAPLWSKNGVRREPHLGSDPLRANWRNSFPQRKTHRKWALLAQHRLQRRELAKMASKICNNNSFAMKAKYIIYLIHFYKRHL